MSASIPATALNFAEPVVDSGAASAMAPANSGGDGAAEGGFADALMALLGAAPPDTNDAPVHVEPADNAAAPTPPAADGQVSASVADLALLGLPADFAPRLPAVDLRALLAQREGSRASSTMELAGLGATLTTLATEAAGEQSREGLLAAAGEGARLELQLAGAEAAVTAAPGPEVATAAADSAASLPDGRGGLSNDPVQSVRTLHEPSPRLAASPIQSQVGSPQWGAEFAARISWVVDRGDQTASIRLSPEDLGPVEVRVAIREGEASIWFGAAHAETRQAIEQAIPRLREMLSANGLSLADAGVFQQAPRDPQRGFVRADALRAKAEAMEPQGMRIGLRARGLIDDYA